MRDDLPCNAKSLARALRRAMTEPEKRLWRLLRDRRMQGMKFRRQAPVGPYIADFICLDRRLIVEADGSQHADNAYDEQRDAWLRVHGYDVLRFWNDDILREPSVVLDTIASRCGLPW